MFKNLRIKKYWSKNTSKTRIKRFLSEEKIIEYFLEFAGTVLMRLGLSEFRIYLRKFFCVVS